MDVEQILEHIRSGDWKSEQEVIDLTIELRSQIRRGLRLGEPVEVELATIAVQMAQIPSGRELARALWEVAYHSAMGCGSE